MYNSDNDTKAQDNLLDSPELQDPDSNATEPTLDLSETGCRQLVAQITTKPEMMALARHCMKATALVHKAQRTILTAAYEHYDEFGKLPSKDVLFERVRHKAKDDPRHADFILGELKGIQDYLGIDDPDYYAAQIRGFAQKKAISSLVKSLTDGEPFAKAHSAYLESVAAVTPSNSERDRLYGIDDIENMPDIVWQIADHFPRNGTVVVFGPSGVGKSFYCLQMGWSIATGTEFLGHPVVKGNVLYICSEGSYGLKHRWKAWQTAMGITDKPKNIKFSTVCHNFQDRGEVMRLIALAKKELGTIDVVFIDTLSRNFGGGDPDKNQDMMKYLGNVDHVRESTGAAVVSVHHTGWADSGRERGAKSLRDYSDTSIGIEADGDDHVEVVCRKQKDAPEFPTYCLSKTKSEKSLVLRLAPIRTSKTADSDLDKLAEVLKYIPDLALTETPTVNNTVTLASLMTSVGCDERELRRRLKPEVDSGRVQRTKFGSSSRAPYNYFRHGCLA